MITHFTSLPNTISKLSIYFSILLLCLTGLSSCGGGGGGGSSDFEGAARVFVELSPGRIDTGDRIQVTVDLRDIHPDGVMLKIRFPNGLRYVSASSFLVSGSETLDATPTFNVKGSDAVRFLVYFLSKASFGSMEEGKLRLELEGISEVDNGEVQIDADVNNPLIADTSEFSASDPEFSAEDGTRVDVTA